MSPKPLGRRTPTDFSHVEKHPLSAIAAVEQFSVNKTLRLPYWHRLHDQGSEGACVGHGKAMSLAILNTQQRVAAGITPATRRYNPWWIWNRAKSVDEWDDTNPGDNSGTSVNAACKVVRAEGAVRYGRIEPDYAEGISAYRWATTVDEMRQCIAFHVPVTIGVNWYSNFDKPVGGWIGRGDLGAVRGGHSVCIYGASDTRQAFRLKNSWGAAYPQVWVPYTTMQRLLDEDGEAAIITDR